MNLFAKHKFLLPLLVLLASAVATLVAALRGYITVAGDQYAFSLDARHYGAFILIATNILTYFRLRVFYKWVLLVTLVAGVFNLVNFSPVETRFSILNDMMIGVQPLCMLAAVATLLLGYKQIGAAIFGVAASELLIADGLGGTVNMEKINDYKRRYIHYATHELNRIVSENKYTPEALEAARQVLEERAL